LGEVWKTGNIHPYSPSGQVEDLRSILGTSNSFIPFWIIYNHYI